MSNLIALALSFFSKIGEPSIKLYPVHPKMSADDNDTSVISIEIYNGNTTMSSIYSEMEEGTLKMPTFSVHVYTNSMRKLKQMKNGSVSEFIFHMNWSDITPTFIAEIIRVADPCAKARLDYETDDNLSTINTFMQAVYV
jgi:hypothetical protein